MPFRLFADDKPYKTHKEVRDAALLAGHTGYIWYGPEGTNPKWIPIKTEQKEPKPAAMLLTESLRRISIVAYMIENDGVSSNIPVQSVCREAADEIERLLDIINTFK